MELPKENPKTPSSSDTPAQTAFAVWAKLRIDEMDAVLKSLEGKATQINADAQARAAQLVADLKKLRQDFETQFRMHATEGEAALELVRKKLEGQCEDFQRQIKTYIETAGKQVEHQEELFKEMAASQITAWREGADKLQKEAANAATAHRASIDEAIKRMKVAATEAEDRLKKVREAGSQSWPAFNSALVESRKAFDHATQVATDALKRALT
ncbi:MAG: hypothetical protein PSY14_16440 [bacterium]|nr:hypothetical protein [bacterium]